MLKPFFFGGIYFGRFFPVIQNFLTKLKILISFKHLAINTSIHLLWSFEVKYKPNTYTFILIDNLAKTDWVLLFINLDYWSQLSWLCKVNERLPFLMFFLDTLEHQGPAAATANKQEF